MTLTKEQAIALTRTGQGRVEYTCGVLDALGHMALSAEIATLASAKAFAERDVEKELSKGDDQDFSMESLLSTPDTPEYRKAAAYLEDVLDRNRTAWAKVDAMAQEARDVLERADPMGMGQAV